MTMIFYSMNGICKSSAKGEHAALLVIDEARKVMQSSKSFDEELIGMVYDCEVMLDQFITAKRNSHNSTDSNNSLFIIGKNCQDRFYNLGFKITKTLIQKVADEFLDINHPLRKLADVVMSSQGILAGVYILRFW